MILFFPLTPHSPPLPRGYFHFVKASLFSVFLRLVTTGYDWSKHAQKKAGLPGRFPVLGIRHFQAISMSALCPLFSGFLFSFELKNLKNNVRFMSAFFNFSFLQNRATSSIKIQLQARFSFLILSYTFSPLSLYSTIGKGADGDFNYSAPI